MTNLDLFDLSIAGCVVVMALVWWWAVRIDNFGIVDGAWAFCFTLVAGLCAALGQGALSRRLLIGVMVAVWSLRLGGFLTLRLYRHHPEEDGRYRELRQRYHPRVRWHFFWFFQIQALSVVLLSVPFLLTAQNTKTQLGPWDFAGAALWAVSLLGEAVADHQMNRFKKDPANKNKTCQVGLWNYSRHPNYFFESGVWWSYFVIALGAPHGIYTAYAPLVMLFLLLKVTGVPPSEAQALKSRGDEFRRYQRRVSVFVPWFPRKEVK